MYLAYVKCDAAQEIVSPSMKGQSLSSGISFLFKTRTDRTPIPLFVDSVKKIHLHCIESACDPDQHSRNRGLCVRTRPDKGLDPGQRIPILNSNQKVLRKSHNIEHFLARNADEKSDD